MSCRDSNAGRGCRSFGEAWGGVERREMREERDERGEIREGRLGIMDLGIRSYLQYNVPDGITLSLPKKIYEGEGKMNPTRMGLLK